MGLAELKNNGAFVLALLVVVVLAVSFGLEEVGEALGVDSLDFSLRRTVRGWFTGPAPHVRALAPLAPVDWERYRRDLEQFTGWSEDQRLACISLPREPVVEQEVEEVVKPVRRIWPVPIASCTPADPLTNKKGYAFISGFVRPFMEGSVIESTEDLCGYEIVFIGKRSVWLRAVFDPEGDSPMRSARFPEFSRLEGESLVKGNRRYVAQNAFPLASGGLLSIDSFLPPDGVVFKILDESRREVATILCVVIGEKGGE